MTDYIIPEVTLEDPWVEIPKGTVIPAGVRHRLEHAGDYDWNTSDSQVTVLVHRSDLPKVIPSKSRRERLIDEVIKASAWPQSVLTDKRSRATVGEWIDCVESAAKVVDGDE